MGRTEVGVDEDAADHDNTWEGGIGTWRSVSIWTVAERCLGIRTCWEVVAVSLLYSSQLDQNWLPPRQMGKVPQTTRHPLGRRRR